MKIGAGWRDFGEVRVFFVGLTGVCGTVSTIVVELSCVHSTSDVAGRTTALSSASILASSSFWTRTSAAVIIPA